MRWQLILKEFSFKLIYIKGSKNIVADALSHQYKIDNRNDTNCNNFKVEPTVESLSENFALNKKMFFTPLVSKRFQHMDKSLIEIA